MAAPRPWPKPCLLRRMAPSPLAPTSRSLLAALCVLSSGCLFTPANGSEVCGADGSVRFSGYLPSPGRTVSFQASTTPNGPWTPLGSTVASSNPLTFSSTGEQFYRFDTQLPVDAWASDPAGLSVYLRALEGSFRLLTFELQNASGQTGTACILSEMSGGLTAVQAALACDRDDSVVRIDAPLESSCGCTPFSAPGDLVVDDARSAALAQCVTAVGGALRVLDSAPDLVKLDQLISIGGDAELHYEMPPPGGGAAFRNRAIDLSAVTTIGGSVSITTRRGPAGDKTLDTQTGAVSFIGGDVLIETHDNNVTAFASVNSVAGSVTLQGPGGAAGNLDVFGGQTFPNLTTVGGNLTVQGFFACNNVFNSVVSVGGDVEVRAVRLAPGQSFTNLDTVTGDLRFRQMKEFGPTWPALTSVGGELHAVDNSLLVSLSSLPVGAVDVFGLRLEDNANLITLDGSIQAGGGDIAVSGSPSLSQCEANAFLSDQISGGWTGSSIILGTVACP